jgi:hypothetical protein
VWRGEAAQRRKSHGGGGSTLGGFIGWKNKHVLGSLAENRERKSVPVRFT